MPMNNISMNTNAKYVSSDHYKIYSWIPMQNMLLNINAKYIGKQVCWDILHIPSSKPPWKSKYE